MCLGYFKFYFKVTKLWYNVWVGELLTYLLISLTPINAIILLIQWAFTQDTILKKENKTKLPFET